jgi:outer membrane protein OmpA-like peptidoglycan-associated protein
MKHRALLLALASASSVLPNSAYAADDFCSRLIVQAVTQFCQLLPNGMNLCQPVALMGPGPECTMPERPALVPVPLGPPTMQPPAPWTAPYASGSWPASTAMPPAASLLAPTQQVAAAPAPARTPTPPDLPRIMPAAPKPSTAATPAPPVPPVAPTVPVAPTPVAAAAARTPSAAAAPVIAPSIAPVAAPSTALATQTAVAKPMPAAPVAAAAKTPSAAPAPVVAPVAVPAPSTVAATQTAATPAVAAKPVPASPVVAATPVAAAPSAAPAVAAEPVQPAATRSVTEEAADALAHFDFDSATLTVAGRALLDAWVAQAPKDKPVRVSGHADRLGPEPYNLNLSLRRAEAVKQYLSEKGISPRRIQLEAKGEAEPVKRCKGGATPTTKACLAPNRRVEIDPE